MSTVPSSQPESLLHAAIAFLRHYPPFDAMEDEAMRHLASRLSLAYYAEGTTILSPRDPTPEFLYIIRNGVVRLEQPAMRGQSSPVVTRLGPGECFSVGALLEDRPTGSVYTSAADTFCYQLAATDFAALLERSARFREFSIGYLSSLLRESRRLLKMGHAAVTLDEHAMARTLRSLIARPAVSCAPATAIGEALQTMQQEAVGSILIVGASGRPQGIFTRDDVLERVALARRDLADPISMVMTPTPHTLPADATAHDAALLIARHRVRHVPIVDAGSLIGVVTERDLFRLQRANMRGIVRTIADARDIGSLQQAADDIRGMARDMIGEAIAPGPLTAIVSALNDALTARIVALEAEQRELAGIPWAWLAFGSEGRQEQTICTDQDNGLVFLCVDGLDAERVRERLLPFAQAVNRTLDACGYPLCRGGIMAGNARCSLSLDEWTSRFADWIANSDPQALLDGSIFFDFRAIYGREDLAATLRERLLALAARTPRFLKQLAEQALLVRPPLGVLRDFVTEQSPGIAGTLDLKKSAARLFVDAARVLALAAGVADTGTVQRLRQAGARLGVSEDEVGAWVDAFEYVQMLRLRCQCPALARDQCAGENLIRPDALNEVDRRILKECLRQARALQSRLALDYRR
jgi:CBS domain-containing protein